MSTDHAAKKWVEEQFPTVEGSWKAILILAYGAGMDAGMAEAEEIIRALMVERDAAIGDF